MSDAPPTTHENTVSPWLQDEPIDKNAWKDRYPNVSYSDVKTIVLEAIQCNKDACFHVPELLLDDKDIAFAMVIADPHHLRRISLRLRNDAEIVKLATRKVGTTLSYAFPVLTPIPTKYTIHEKSTPDPKNYHYGYSSYHGLFNTWGEAKKVKDGRMSSGEIVRVQLDHNGNISKII
jgi:hypothetical protein